MAARDPFSPEAARLDVFKAAIYLAIKENRNFNPDTGVNVCAGILDAKETSLYDAIAKAAEIYSRPMGSA